jgi:dGTPase
MMLCRADLEANEYRNLAPCAERSADSLGRRFDEPHDYFRTAFTRDRDRIVHSSAYRRLGNKTQVFVTLEGEYYRTRLTHTEEATQIALTIVRALGLNPDLAEAICRAHDLGHAPFGHAGEAVLAECMAADGGFEHNAQTLRIVDLLEHEYAEFRGLNLCWEVREGIAKHGNHALPGPSGEFTSFPQPSLEAQIADLADSIAYGCHDLDDGLAAGLLHWEALNDSAPAWWRQIKPRLTDLPIERHPDLARRMVKRQLVNLLVSDVIEVTAKKIEAVSPASVGDVRRQAVPLAAFSPEMSELRLSLHEYLTAHLYKHHLVETMWEKAQRLIRAIFESVDRAPNQLPAHIQKRVGLDGDLRRVICDYIAEMTDRAAVREYRRLFEFDLQVLP